jgi:endoglucanase
VRLHKILLVVLLAVVALMGCRRELAQPAQLEPTAEPAPATQASATQLPSAQLEPTAEAAPATQTPAAQGPATPAERLGRGVNLGNALEAPNEGEWGMVIEADFFTLIAEAGFDTVRVPIRWSAHAIADAPYTVDQAFFERVDWVIQQSLDQELNVVINMHHYEELFASPDAHADRFVAIWEQIATRYRDQPDGLYLELLNEPHANLDPGKWNTLLLRTIEAVRAIDDYHTLVIGTAEWGGIGGLNYLTLPKDETNLVVTFHYYDPFLFTHQGAEWTGPETGTLGVTWPGPPAQEVEPVEAAQSVQWVRQWFQRYNQNPSSNNPATAQEIDRAFDHALAWSEARGVPLWLGEFGAYSTADMDSRVRWTATVREAAEARGFGWAYWEFGAGFGVYDRDAQAWREPLLMALIPE